MPREWVAIGAQPSLATVARRLKRAFDTAGYGETSYYRAPGGFALVSRIERIRTDATPLAEAVRWAVAMPRPPRGIVDYIRALFDAPSGYYRVIVFLVTNEDFFPDDEEPTSAEATRWVSDGAVRLPDGIGAQPYTAQHYTVALIYEFARGDVGPPVIRIPSDALGQVHLEKAGLWDALAAP